VKAQGSLEYLIIIAAVLIVAGVTVLFVSGSAGASKQSALYSACQESAITCRSKHVLNPKDPCNFCNTACTDPTSEEEIFPGAIECCKLGKHNEIYEGSEGCEGMIEGNGCNQNSDCNDGNE